MSMYSLKDIRDGRYVVDNGDNVTTLLSFAYVEQATRRYSEKLGREDLAPFPYMVDSGTPTAFARFVSAMELAEQSDITSIEPIPSTCLDGDMFDDRITKISAVRNGRQRKLVERLLVLWRYLAPADAEWLFEARAKLETGAALSTQENQHLCALGDDLSGYI